MNQCTKKRTHATILGGVEWTRLREELKECRKMARLGQTALAALIDVDKSTINRIENVYGEPQHKPTLEIIERWVLVTGLTLSAFFARIEGLPPSATIGNDLSSQPKVSPDDDAVPLTPEDTETYIAIGKAIKRIFDKSQSKRGAYSGPPADSGAEEPKDGVHPRSPSDRPSWKKRPRQPKPR
jgi:transcriptional regulator with XRE-family HTH domain